MQADPRGWNRMIPYLLFAYSEVSCETTGFSPFELLYGRHIRGPLQILREQMTQKSVEPMRKQSAIKYLLDMQERLRRSSELANEKATKDKLMASWKEPFTVLRRVNGTNYEIDLGTRVTTLHIDLLREWYERLEVRAVNLVKSCFDGRR